MLAGYWVGEFGWELMRWQGYLRNLSRREDVIVGCLPGHEYLYQDFAKDIKVFRGVIKSKNMWLGNQRQYPMDGGICPCKEICMGEIEQDFFSYGLAGSGTSYDILIHARSTENMRTGYRNWPVSQWEDLVHGLSPLSVASIGSLDGAHHIAGTDDLRGIDLKVLCGIMSKSGVLVSPSSGPAHLASLCGLRHVVWTDSKHQAIGHTNKERYLRGWNPFSTNCCVIEDRFWRPKVDIVAEKTIEMYNMYKLPEIF